MHFVTVSKTMLLPGLLILCRFVVTVVGELELVGEGPLPPVGVEGEREDGLSVPMM